MAQLKYFQDKNFFLEWVMYHDISSSECLVWHTLMSVGNRLGRKTVFNLPTSTLEKATGLSRKTLVQARGKLTKRGFIRFKKGGRNAAPLYEMLPIHETLNMYNNQSVNEGEEKGMMAKEVAKKDRPAIVAMYEQQIGRVSPVLEERLTFWLNIFPEEVIEKAMIVMTMAGGKSFNYLQVILEQWQVAEIKSLADVEIFLEKQASQKKKNVVPFRSGRTEKQNENIDDILDAIYEEDM